MRALPIEAVRLLSSLTSDVSRNVSNVSDLLQDAAQDDGNAGVRITGSDQPAQPSGSENQEGTGPAENESLNSEGEEDMQTDGPAQATRRRPVDPVLPNKRRSYVKKKMGVLKGKVGKVCRVCCHVSMKCHVMLWAAPVTAPLPSQVHLALNVACYAWPDMTDRCMCS